ncbi:hypothetical protein SAMN05660199_02638 [Klenkia soli]|uniref:Oligosaccharide repeat unit polymerase n=1 Tax=Klenkia soli TaxID=1052260 RepID=A0A1H0MUD8_9ACTN|nr:oligosaccharide repeat unit polymerase [Klenkia soli]SDO83991.1 hypothetical protein SAMN05660199_02638 [Klenkia soli]
MESARGTTDAERPAPVVGSFPLGALSALLFCFAVPGYVVLATPDPVNRAWPGALLVAVLVGLRYAWIVGRGEQRLIEMTVWLFTYVFLGLAPLVQLREGISPGTTPRTFATLVPESFLVVGLGSLAFLVGGLLRAVRPGGPWRPRVRRPVAVVEPPTTGIPRPIWLLGLGSLLLTAYYLVNVAPALFTDATTLNRQSFTVWPNTATQGIVNALAIMPILVTVVALTLLRLRRPRPEWTLAEKALHLATVLALVATVNPLNSARYVFGTVALALAGAVGLYATARRFRLVAVGAIVGLLVIFPVADAFRTANTGEQVVSPVTALQSGDFDAFAQIDNTLLYVQEYGTTQGRQALGVVLFWVPRAYWPDKPDDTGVLLATFRDYDFQNLSAPLWSELFINGGWLAVGLGGLVFGWWARGRDDGIVTRLRRSRAPGVLGCILPFYFVFLLRGSLLQAMANLVVMLACAWFADRAVRSRLGAEPDDLPAAEPVGSQAS